MNAPTTTPVLAYYAGIGSRNITLPEQDLIRKLAAELALNGLVAYSGNADGADISFQEGSSGRCVIMLPSLGFNAHHYDPGKSIDHFVLGDKMQGQQAVYSYHPRAKMLTPTARLFLARNYYQVHGTAHYPMARFVVAVADVDAVGHEVGGTGHTCRIARAAGVPVFNLRSLGLDKTWDAIVHHLKATGSPLPDTAAPAAPKPPVEFPSLRAIPGMPTGQRDAVIQALRAALAWGMTYGPVIPAHQWGEMRDKQVDQHLASIERYGRLS